MLYHIRTKNNSLYYFFPSLRDPCSLRYGKILSYQLPLDELLCRILTFGPLYFLSRCVTMFTCFVTSLQLTLPLSKISNSSFSCQGSTHINFTSFHFSSLIFLIIFNLSLSVIENSGTSGSGYGFHKPKISSLYSSVS